MRIYSIYSEEFRSYGRIVDNVDTYELVREMEKIPNKESGVAYMPSIASLEQTSAFHIMRDNVFGGMAIQIGLCWGKNTKLNCLEYHKNSEVNVGTTPFILLLALRSDLVNERLDTSKVKAFEVPEGIAVEIFSTSLHYAPARISSDDSFKVAIILPKGTNTEKPDIAFSTSEDKLLWARNKWLIAHPESTEAKEGAFVGLDGININLSK